MQGIEQIFLREAARLCHKEMGYKKLIDLVPELARRSRLDEEVCRKYVHYQSVSDKIEQLSSTMMEMMQEHRTSVLAAVSAKGEPAAASYLASIFDRHAPMAPSRAPIAENIFHQWRNTYAKGNRTLITGVYQVFRRYKLSDHTNISETIDDVIITELFYVDSTTLEAVLVTSEGNLYWGSLHINHRTTLYGLMQRPHDLSDANRPVSQRFYAVNIKTSDVGRQLALYSGLYIKTGDVTELPVGGDCLFLHVPRHGNELLYDRMRGLMDHDFVERCVDDDRLIMDYIASFNEHDPEARPIRIEDIPFLAKLVEGPRGNEIFRSPSRAWRTLAITNVARRTPLKVFRRAGTDQPSLFD